MAFIVPILLVVAIVLLHIHMWGGVYFCTEWVEEKKRRKSLWGVGLSKAGAGKNLHQLLLWFDKKCVIFCTEMYGK